MTGEKRQSGASNLPSAASAGGSSRSLIALHRSRGFEWHPSPVTTLSPCPAGNLLVVGYESGDVELWDMELLVCLQRIAACGSGVEITCCTWSIDSAGTWRMFASLMDGNLVEVCWREGALQAPTDSFGGTVWCLASKPRTSSEAGAAVIAAACDDGGLRLFEAEAGTVGLSLQRIVARVDGRVLAVAWSPTGDTLYAAGASGIIHVLPVGSGVLARRITVSNTSTPTHPVVVWCLKTLPDGTLVSGDSEGAVQFWDAAFGTLVQRFQQHKAHVLALAAAEDGSTVFASGVDSQVAQYSRVAALGSSPASWTYTHYKRPHVHDVRALAVASGHRKVPVLISAGVDGSLVAYSVNAFLQEHPVRLTRCPQRPICHVSQQHPSSGAAGGAVPRPARLLVAQGSTLDVTALAQSTPPLLSGPNAHEGGVLDLQAPARHLAKIEVGGCGRVVSAALSPDGGYVAAACGKGLRCYSLVDRPALPAAVRAGPHPGRAAAGQNAVAAAKAVAASRTATFVEVTRVKLPPLRLAVIAVALTDTALVAAHTDGSLTLLGLDPATANGAAASSSPAVAPPASLPCHPSLAAPMSDATSWQAHQPPVTQLVASGDGRFLAAAGPNGVALYRLPSLQALPSLLCPGDPAPVAAMAFSADAALLAVVSSEGTLRVFDVAAGGALLTWSADNHAAVDAVMEAMPGSPIGLSFNPAAELRQLLVYTAGAVSHLDLQAPLSAPAAVQKKKRRRPDASSAKFGISGAQLGANGRTVILEHPVVFVGHSAGDALLVLEKPWEDVLQGLPLPLHRHTYGT